MQRHYGRSALYIMTKPPPTSMTHDALQNFSETASCANVLLVRAVAVLLVAKAVSKPVCDLYHQPRYAKAGEGGPASYRLALAFVARPASVLRDQLQEGP